MKCYYSIIPPFHYSCLGYAEWLAGNSLFSTFCRISDTYFKIGANETILKIINDAILAPSSGNDQPWKFIIVNDKLIMKEISDEAKKNLLKRISLNPGDYAKKYEKMLNNESFNIFYNAPSMIFIIGEKKVKNMVINCTLAASYFMFSAAVHGLGTCWINFATVIDSPEILNKLGIPKECGIVAPIIIGYPEEIPNIPNRKEPEILKII